VGTSANAVNTRMRTALIFMLLRYLHQRSRFGWCLSNLMVLMIGRRPVLQYLLKRQ